MKTKIISVLISMFFFFAKGQNCSVTITSSKSAICTNDSAQICAPSGYTSYKWNTTGGGATTRCIYAKTGGNYWVTVTDNNACTAESNHISISVYPPPLVTIIKQGDTLAAPGFVSYQWLLNGNAINGANSPAFIAGQTGIYQVRVGDLNGCIATSSAVLVFRVAPKSVTICSDQSTTLTASGGDTYFWSNGANTAAITIAPSQTTTYTVTATKSGVTATATATVSVINSNRPNASISHSVVTICKGESRTLTASGGESYLWSTGDTSRTITVTPSSTTTYFVSVSNSGVCGGTDIDSCVFNVRDISKNFNVSISGQFDGSGSGFSVCEGHIFSIAIVGSGIYRYNWSTGDTTNYILKEAANSVYSVTITENNGCSVSKIFTVNTVPSPGFQPIIGNPNIIPFQVYPYSVNSVNGNNYNWLVKGGAIQSGQGTTSVNILWGATGPFQVGLIQTNFNGMGCSDTSYLAVASNNCSLSNNVIVAGSTQLCNGDTTLLIAQTSLPSSLQWFKNGSLLSGEINDSIWVTSAGSYQVQISSGNCTVLSNIISLNYQSPPAPPVITSMGNSGSCVSPNIILRVSGTYQGYLWSTGSNANSITVTASGNYTVTVTGTNGCKAVSQPYPVNISFIAPYQICLVSVDSATGKNVVIWEKPSKYGVDSFLIYKETNQFNVFNKIGAVGRNNFSTFIDINSNGQQQSDRYRIAVLDTCGGIALQSLPHKTIHLNINQGIGGVWNLQWNHYEGFSYSSYNIYRGTANNPLQLISTISSGNNSYTDINPPANILFYQIEAVNPNGCIPTAKIESYSSTKSNIVSSLNIGIADQLDGSQWVIYPNPTTSFITIESQTEKLIILKNLLGKILYQDKIEGRKQIDISNLPSGMYFVNNRKFVKE